MTVSKVESATIASALAFLFVPGDRPERFSKALTYGPDFIIIDLEDAVSTENKKVARDALGTIHPEQAHKIIVRVNSAATTHFLKDVKACVAANVAGLMLPKSEGAADLDALAALSGNMPVITLVESAKGLSNLGEIAAHATTVRIAFGSIDYRIDLAIAHDGVGLAAARSEIVLRSRLASIAPPIEGVTPNFRDEDQLVNDLGIAKSFGFGAKLAIHPLQIPAIKRSFLPSSDEIAWANKF